MAMVRIGGHCFGSRKGCGMPRLLLQQLDQQFRSLVSQPVACPGRGWLLWEATQQLAPESLRLLVVLPVVRRLGRQSQRDGCQGRWPPALACQEALTSGGVVIQRCDHQQCRFPSLSGIDGPSIGLPEMG